ncbi:MAG: YiiD C-terminal domain-containing protein [Thermodesulfobacteriota bacterium]
MSGDQYLTVAQMAIASVEGIKRTGLKIIELRERYAKVMMPLAGNTNHLGMMYAGSLFTLGEFSGGIIHIVSFDFMKLVPVVKQVSIRFRRPALSDVTIEVSLAREEAVRLQEEALSKGKADFTLELEIKDAAGEVVSLVSGVWQIRKMPEELAAQWAKAGTEG